MKFRFTLQYLLLAAMFALPLIGCSSGESVATSGTASPSASAESPASTASASPSSETEPSEAPVASESAPPASPVPAPSGIVTAMRLADFETGWTGGEGWIARTDDGGKSWRTQWKDKATVLQLFALNGKEVWATLDSGSVQLLHSTNGGKDWAVAGTVPNRGFLHFTSSKEAFSGNARTQDGGKTWTTYEVPDDIVGDPYFHDGSNGWAVSQTDGKFKFLRTTDGAKTWKEVYARGTVAPVTGTVIRSAGKNDAWVELVGDSGMSQTSYSLFHTADGGKSWIPVLANNQAGSGPAPGYKMDEETNVPRNEGAGPGNLNVVDPKVAIMGGKCNACDDGNTLGKTTDGGKTWTNLKAAFPGYGPQFIGAQDAKHIWWINTDNEEPSVLYTSSDGGANWKKVHSFGKPR
ncbi:WD40/YVTN/BNR-like repeat-containing protein [Cohnella sp. GCM10027633]|uniref:WD40/YVTN/BNR-like repeat-containing protein n=1 Tax=unclassified Cohnella TaxID=2636738 RepID=UPI00363B5B24